MESLLEGPAYTKPAEWRGRTVPEILASGNHGAIARWRRDQAFARTGANRPELLARLDPAELDKKDRIALAALGWRVDGDRLVREPVTDTDDKSGQDSAHQDTAQESGQDPAPGDDFTDRPSS
jgi:tRNA (guanine37-N1)-methyltransferase